MAMNPVKLMQIKATIAGVERRHPNLRKFFEAVGREKLREGTILELKVQTPEGKKLLKSLGIEEDYEGIGHLVLGYAAAPAKEAAPRKADYVYYIR